jgi:hypothetical protein
MCCRVFDCGVSMRMYCELAQCGIRDTIKRGADVS